MPLHVVVNDPRGVGWPVTNLDEDALRERFVAPWLRGEAIVARGRHFNAGQYWLSIYEGPNQSAQPDDIRLSVSLKFNATEVTDQYITAPFGAERPAPQSITRIGAEFAEDRRAVMIVHGRDARLRKALFEFIRALDLRPLEWTTLVSSVSVGAPYIGEILDEAFDRAQAVVVLMTPDDVARLRPELVPEGDADNEGIMQAQPRPNVFLEAGMAIGRFPLRTILVEAGTMRPASDLAGRHAVWLSEGPECRRDLAQRLETAGCLVQSDGTDWLTAGDFCPPPPLPAMVADGDAGPDRGDVVLQRKIEALRTELADQRGFVTAGVAEIYNSLLDEADASDLPKATRQVQTLVSGRAPRSTMVAEEMRVHLGQLRARLA